MTIRFLPPEISAAIQNEIEHGREKHGDLTCRASASAVLSCETLEAAQALFRDNPHLAAAELIQVAAVAIAIHQQLLNGSLTKWVEVVATP